MFLRDEKRRLTEDEKREIRFNKGELDCETEVVVARYPDEFDLQLIRTYTEEYARKRSLRPQYSIEDILLLSKLGKRLDGVFKPNLACYLLFAQDPRSLVPGAFIRLIRYDGTEESFGKQLNSIFDRQVEGPLPKQLLEAEQVLDSQIRSFTRLGKDGRFFTKPEYPKDVWLEAIVNAIVHRSYNLKHMNIFVKMFENKLLVESPGTFLPPTTAETVYDAHNPRNPNLMWALYYFDFVKCAFEGTRRMRESMREANLPAPEFSQKQIGISNVQVILKNDIEHRKAFVHADVSDIVSEETYVRLSDEAKMIINCLADRKTLNVNETSMILDRDWGTAKRVLDELLDMKILDRSPGKPRDRNRRYFLRRRRLARSKLSTPAPRNSSK